MSHKQKGAPRHAKKGEKGVEKSAYFPKSLRFHHRSTSPNRASLCSFILDKLPIVFNIGFMETLIFIASQCFVTLRKMKAYSYLVSFWQVIATRKVTDIMEATQAKRK